MNILSSLIWGVSLFIVFYLVNYFIILKGSYKSLTKNKKKKKNKQLKDLVGLSYVVPRFNLDVDKMDLNLVFALISIINSFILSFVCVIIYIVPWDMAFKMLLGFVLLFGLIFSLYELLGKFLVKKGWRKE